MFSEDGTICSNAIEEMRMVIEALNQTVENTRYKYDNRVTLQVLIRDLIITPGRRQSKTLLTIDKRGPKITRNSVFDCHLSPFGRQMAIKNYVSSDC